MSVKKLPSPVSQKLPSQACMAAFQIVGDMRTLAIIYFLTEGPKRFSELQKLTHINPATLTNRLKHVRTLGIIERREQETDQQSVSYQLTSLGAKLLPILDQIEAFAQQLPNTIQKENR